ncbi:MAG: hypothetical protein R6U98_36345, partial [Pirellulaceae bacterium]
SLQNQRTTAGGVILGDAYSAGSDTSKYTETYVCPQGFDGEYRLLIRRVWGEVTAGKVTVDIRTNNPDRPHIHAQVPLGEKDALVRFELTDGRRTEQLAPHHLANLEQPKVAADRSVVTRQLNRYDNSCERGFQPGSGLPKRLARRTTRRVSASTHHAAARGGLERIGSAGRGFVGSPLRPGCPLALLLTNRSGQYV